jgi:peptide deformylase
MILPIVAYGSPVLKKKATDISKDYPELKQLIENMWETMYNASGVGLAAPQIGKAIRLFIIDSAQLMEDIDEEDEDAPLLKDGCKKVFINAEILECTGEVFSYNEGCLSIPNVREDVDRHETIRIKYLDENFKEHIDTFSAINARIIQHEYDHIEGILFTDHLKPLKRTLLKKKLEDINKGAVRTSYRMKTGVK